MKFEIDFVESYSRENIIRELQRLAAALGKNSVTQRDINTHGRISSVVVSTRFGTLRNALLEAGLKPSFPCIFTDQELRFFLAQVWTQSFKKHGRSPVCYDLAAFGCPVAASTFAKRFGSWNKALLAAAEFMPASTGPAPPPSPSVAPGRKRISIRKRFFVLKRDHYRCCMCKRTGVELEVDHRVPVAQGGSNALDNLQALCSDCNRGKSDSSE
jgi:hypothetical protein